MSTQTITTVTIESTGANDMTGATDAEKLYCVQMIAETMAQYLSDQTNVYVEVDPLPSGDGFALTTDDNIDPEDIDALVEAAYAAAL